VIEKTTEFAAKANVQYLKHWIEKNLSEPNVAQITELALDGKRSAWSYAKNEEVVVPLALPGTFIMEVCNEFSTSIQLATAKRIAGGFGHLWAKFESGLDWADHYNMGREDNWNSSAHPLPTPEDVTAQRRYSWEVNPDGVVEFNVNRPQGTAARIAGTLTNFRVEITKLALDRHLVCLFQQLQSVFGLSSDQAIERIETAKGFNLMGIRGGELHKVVMIA
jgi:hypothetical protein